MTRRTAVGLLASGVGAAPYLRAALRSRIRLGGPIFEKHDDPRDIARAHRTLGYSAAYCPDAKVEDTARVQAIEDGFRAEGILISEVGA